MTIYLEYAIIDNLVINCVLLWFVFRSVGHKLVWWKITTFVLIGAIVSVLLPILSMILLASLGIQKYYIAITLLMATKLFTTVLFLYIMLGLIKFLSKREKVTSFVHDISFTAKDKQFKCKGFLDTGNSLTDPVEKLPIVVISLDLYLKIFPVHNGRYIEFSTVGKSGKMLVFKPQGFKVAGKDFDVIFGVSMKNFGGSTKYDVLLNANLL